MRKVALRGLFARKLRLVLTALAVALGVTLIAGTYVFTDTINRSFDKIFTQSAKGTDASVTPRKTIDTSNNGGTQPTVSPTLLAAVRKQPGVQSADGSVFDAGTILGKDGKRIGAGGAPHFIASIADQPRFDAFTVKEGRQPQTAARSRWTPRRSKKAGWKLGDKISIVATAPRKDYRSWASRRSPASTRSAARPSPTCSCPRRSASRQARLRPDPGVREAGHLARAAARPLRTAMPRTVNVRTGREEAREQSNDVKSNLSFLTTLLLAFAGISLFVGAFIIFNTFSITVTQRTREFALLRTLGASRRPGHAVGDHRGLHDRRARIDRRPRARRGGRRRPARPLQGDRRRPAVERQRHREPARSSSHSLVGTVVTSALVARAGCARRASRRSRRSREGAVPPSRGPSRKATIAGIVLGVIGVGLMVAGLFGSFSSNASLSFVGGGALATFLGIALDQPVPRPPAGVGRRPAVRAGRAASPGTWRARARSVSPGELAVTAAALMVGVALVAFLLDLRRRDQDDDRQGGRRQPQGRVRRAEHRRLLARSRPRSSDASSACPASPKTSPVPVRPGDAWNGVKGNQPVVRHRPEDTSTTSTASAAARRGAERARPRQDRDQQGVRRGPQG